MTVTNWLHSIWPWAYGVPMAAGLYALNRYEKARAGARDRHPANGDW